MTTDPFDNALSAEVWRTRYRYRDPRTGVEEATVRDTWRRVARAVASIEPQRKVHWERRFSAMLEGFRFLPAGRILKSAGTTLDATLFNCFVMGRIEDSLPGIFRRLEESALTMQKGGGIGCDFSTLRPAGSLAANSGRIASGPVSFMQLWDLTCATLLSTGYRRGAMMGVLRCDHPDILKFIDAKRSVGALTNFNLSVLVPDAFLSAVAADQDWPLVFPASSRPGPASARSSPARCTAVSGPTSYGARS
jgi:ribonucleoside-diphosphate reductase alpha chain